MNKVAPQVDNVLQTYPVPARKKLTEIRAHILSVVDEYELEDVQETLKWGEPSYLVKKGSTVRMAWKPKYPEKYFIYFHCQTTLVETFKEVYGELFQYDGGRAMVFGMEAEIPVDELKHCLSLALQYHRIKHLPLLGC